MFNIFNNITPIYALYLFYGAAFLFLGVAITAKDMKGSDLRLAGRLWLLGMLGFLHGAHEWLELGPLIEGRNLSFHQMDLRASCEKIQVCSGEQHVQRCDRPTLFDSDLLNSLL